MAERLKRAAAWLGLVTDDRYPDYDNNDEVTEGLSREELLGVTGQAPQQPGARPASAGSPSVVAPAPSGSSATVTPLETRRPTAVVAAPAPSTPAVSQPRTADMSRIITVHPRTYNEARTIGEHFRDGVPVIMNLTEMEDVDAKRLVDFAAGLIFGTRGSIERVTSKVFLLSPHNVSVTAEDKERIAGGFFNQS